MKRSLIMIVLILLLSISVATIFGCGGLKKFKKDGIEIQLPTDFNKIELEGWPLALENWKKEVLITANRQLGSSFSPSLSSLNSYTQKVLDDKNLEIEYTSYNEKGVIYNWFVYENTIFTYFVVTKMGNSDFYIINFVCESTLFSYYEDYFMSWAWSIFVV